MVILLIQQGTGSPPIAIPVGGAFISSTATLNAPSVAVVSQQVVVGAFIVSTVKVNAPIVSETRVVVGAFIPSGTKLNAPSVVVVPSGTQTVIAGYISSTAELYEPDVDQPGVSCTYGGIAHPVGAEMVLEVRRPQLDEVQTALGAGGWRVNRVTKLTGNRYRVTASCMGLVVKAAV